jgi:hypothetical protein
VNQYFKNSFTLLSLQFVYWKNKIEILIMADQKNQQKNQINIELPDDIAEGTYSNLAIISHSNSEFVLDFIQIVPNMPKARVKSRVILTPFHAKRLMKALGDNINKFENQFGNIAEDEGGGSLPPMNFNTPSGQA